MVHGTLQIFCQDFQQLFDLGFRETPQNNLDNSLLPIQKCHLNVCLNEPKVYKVSQNPRLWLEREILSLIKIPFL